MAFAALVGIDFSGSGISVSVCFEMVSGTIFSICSGISVFSEISVPSVFSEMTETSERSETTEISEATENPENPG